MNFKFSILELDVPGDSAKQIDRVILGLDFNIGFKNVSILKSKLTGIINYDDPDSDSRLVEPKMIYVYKFNDLKSFRNLLLIDSALSGTKFSISVKKNENLVFLSKKFGSGYFDAEHGDLVQIVNIR